MTYSSKIMILMMGLSKNLESHTMSCISTKYNMGNAYLTHLYHLSIVTMELRGCGRPRETGFGLRFRLAQN